MSSFTTYPIILFIQINLNTEVKCNARWYWYILSWLKEVANRTAVIEN